MRHMTEDEKQVVRECVSEGLHVYPNRYTVDIFKKVALERSKSFKLFYRAWSKLGYTKLKEILEPYLTK